MAISQITPVTQLIRDHLSVLSKLGNGPVVLASRSKPAAILLSVHDYQSLEEDAKRWRRQLLADQRSKALQDDPHLAVSFDGLEQGLHDA